MSKITIKVNRFETEDREVHEEIAPIVERLSALGYYTLSSEYKKSVTGDHVVSIVFKHGTYSKLLRHACYNARDILVSSNEGFPDCEFESTLYYYLNNKCVQLLQGVDPGLAILQEDTTLKRHEIAGFGADEQTVEIQIPFKTYIKFRNILNDFLDIRVVKAELYNKSGRTDEF